MPGYFVLSFYGFVVKVSEEQAICLFSMFSRDSNWLTFVVLFSWLTQLKNSTLLLVELFAIHGSVAGSLLSWLDRIERGFHMIIQG